MKSVKVTGLRDDATKTKMFLSFALKKIEEQAICENSMILQDYAEFSLKELLEAGLYQTRQEAIDEAKKELDNVTSIKMDGMVLFTGYRIVNSENYRLFFNGYFDEFVESWDAVTTRLLGIQDD